MTDQLVYPNATGYAYTYLDDNGEVVEGWSPWPADVADPPRDPQEV